MPFAAVVNMMLNSKQLPRRLTATVDLPPEYPDTRLKALAAGSLVGIQLEVHPGSLSTVLKMARAQDPARVHRVFGADAFTDTTRRLVVHLKDFRGAADRRPDMTPSEQRAFRGLARRALCKLLHLVASMYSPEHVRDAVITLHADGWVRGNTATAAMGPNALRAALLRNANNANRAYLAKLTNNELRAAGDSLANQRALESMYSRTLGVVPVDRRRGMVPMVGWLTTALDRCRARL